MSDAAIASTTQEPTVDPAVAQSNEPSPAVEPAPTEPAPTDPAAEAPSGSSSGPASAAGPQFQDAIGFVIGAAVEQVARVVKPQAAVVVAAAFGFPLILSIAVVLFLLAQGWVDARDPKLRMAPQTAVESVVPFKDEEQF